MREILFALCAVLAVATARVVITAESQNTPHLLGAESCTWGPSFWCHNLTNAAACKATQHCINGMWKTLNVPEDDDSVCGICKDMVQQARDQLESNQTQEDLKAVFEGSCALMQIKAIVKECDALVDQFIPELVETLASQMNPSVVCSVAGLCNSAHIDRLIEEHEKTKHENAGKITLSLSDDEAEPDECSRCYTIGAHMENKLKSTSRDHVLDQMLNMCGQMSSFSDACSSIIIEYFSTIYSHIQDNFKAKNICHLSGQCSGKFHQHEEDGKDLEVEVRPLSSVGMVQVSDDLPCKLCEQLVGHLRDLLVANTTENEFEHVLEGLCKQTKSFAPECKSIVDEYYPEIYNYLIHGLNSNGVCVMAGICPSPDKEVYNGPIWPLLPEKPHEIGVRIMNERKNLGVNGAGIRQETMKTEADEMQLPIDKLMGTSVIIGAPQMDLQGQQKCAFCEYLLHYLQQVITNPATEDEVKLVIDKVCLKLPETVQGTCHEFLRTYGDAVVALVAQEIDPSVVCPMIHVCPSQEFMNAWSQLPKDIMLHSEVEDKPSCPLCLLAVGQLYSVIKDDKTEASIVAALDRLCDHLPKDLDNQCQSLVKGYSKELVEMILADLSPQDICVYIKLCNPNKNPGAKHFYPVDKDGEILTNEIPDYPLETVQKPVADDTKCVVCEFIMQYLEKAMSNKSTKDEIEHIVHGVCNHLPKTVSAECNKFVDQYADLVIELLSQEISPQEICTVIGLCQENMQRLHESIAECALCQAIISTIDNLLANPQVDQKIEDVVSQVCMLLPAAKQGKCTMMMEIYEQSIINALRNHDDSKKICSEMALCSASDFFAMKSGHNRMME